MQDVAVERSMNGQNLVRKAAWGMRYILRCREVNRKVDDRIAREHLASSSQQFSVAEVTHRWCSKSAPKRGQIGQNGSKSAIAGLEGPYPENWTIGLPARMCGTTCCIQKVRRTTTWEGLNRR
jgi:hypothetical protein